MSPEDAAMQQQVQQNLDQKTAPPAGATLDQALQLINQLSPADKQQLIKMAMELGQEQQVSAQGGGQVTNTAPQMP